MLEDIGILKFASLFDHFIPSFELQVSVWRSLLSFDFAFFFFDITLRFMVAAFRIAGEKEKEKKDFLGISSPA